MYRSQYDRHYRRRRNPLKKIFAAGMLLFGFTLLIGTCNTVCDKIGNVELGDRAIAIQEGQASGEEVTSKKLRRKSDGAVFINHWCSICGQTIAGEAYTSHNGEFDCRIVTSEEETIIFDTYCSESCCPGIAK